MNVKLFQEFVEVFQPEFGNDRGFNPKNATLTIDESKVLGDLLLLVYKNELKGSKAKYGLGKEEWDALNSVMSKIGITQNDLDHLHIESKGL